MNIIERPKLLPPLALLRQVRGPSRQAALAGPGGTLSGQELRRIVADLLG